MFDDDEAPETVLKNLWSRASRHTFIEPPLPRAELTANMADAGRPVLAFYLMLALATIIGTSGLLANSAGVIIGAMIVAPLMNPIVALSYCLARASWRPAGSALFLLATGTVLTVLLAYLGTQSLGLRIVGSEILGRTQPTLLDLAVALAAGAAVAFANSRKSIMNVLPGTAIAVALVPPLCVVGIGLGTGYELVPDAGIASQLGPVTSGYDVALGAMVLFITNLAGILLASELVFLVHGYGSVRRGSLGILVTLLASAALCYPLAGSMRSVYSRSEAMKIAHSMIAEQNNDGNNTGRVHEMSVFYDKAGTLTVKMKGVVPVDRADHMRERMQLFRERLESVLDEPVRVHAEALVVPIDRFTIEPGAR